MGYKNLLLLILAFAVVHIQAAPENSINIRDLPPGLNPEFKTEIVNQIQNLSSNIINNTLSGIENVKKTIIDLIPFDTNGSITKAIEQSFQCLENTFLEYIRSFLTSSADLIFDIMLELYNFISSIVNSIPGLSGVLDASNIFNIILNKLLSSIIGYTG